jgi:hypothetical protein
VPSGQRPGGQALSFRGRLAVAAYVLFTWPVMTAFLFGPLAALIAASRPSGRRAWLWLAARTAWLALWALEPGTILEALVAAAAALSTGIGVLMLLFTPGPVSTRALRGTAAVVLGTAALSTGAGLQWRDVEFAVVRQGIAAETAAMELLTRGGRTPDAATVDALRTISDGLRPIAPLFPGLVALLLFAGLCLAALLAPRITGRAVAAVPRRFDEFRFSDHLVWLVILGLVGVLFAGSTTAGGPSASLLAFGVGLFALRGAAVMATTLRAAPRMFIFLLMVGALFLLPFAVGGLTLLGLADIWLDFRRRMAPPTGGLDR